MRVCDKNENEDVARYYYLTGLRPIIFDVLDDFWV